MRSYHALLALIAGLALLACGLLLPRGEERLAMLIRDGALEAALSEARALREHGDRRRATVLAHAGLERRMGRSAVALALVQDHLARRPRDVAALTLEVALHQDLGDAPAHLAALERLVAISPEPNGERELAERYRLGGDAARELALLRRRADAGRATTDETLRLAALLVAAGEAREAADRLAIAERRRVNPDPAIREMLLACLLAGGRSATAAELALGWLDTVREPFRAVEIVLPFAASGEAATLGRMARRIGGALPASLGEIIAEVARRGHPAGARAMLAALADHPASLARVGARDLVAAAATAGESGAVIRLVRRMSAAPARQAELAELAVFAFGPGLLGELAAILGPEALTARPLLGAEVALAAGAEPLARRLLAAVDPAGLAADAQRRWLALVERIGGTALALDLVLASWRRGGPLPALGGRLAEIAVAEARQDALLVALRTGARTQLRSH
jgi:hypothetical protein